jgi:hypothetical protein
MKLAIINLVLNIFLFGFLAYNGVVTKESVLFLSLNTAIFLFALYAKRKA